MSETEGAGAFCLAAGAEERLMVTRLGGPVVCFHLLPVDGGRDDRRQVARPQVLVLQVVRVLCTHTTAAPAAAAATRFVCCVRAKRVVVCVIRF